ncbi:YHYH domain-containing protein [Neobacillus notoginsengisoli]|uniref:YHYH domain-containing protein n=1 Tax=Neobacillus notoginsengisoli TaxID=1578198 RepID=A0A417Z016_9BACI|nr:YHYH domain-containing protein [Neobacillus notoginsengisoli]RHW43477.1 YHYH domain-containing protein [Neobacillus notoginsengisoli]
MYKKVALLVLLFTFVFGTVSFAHSGRTDSRGGHNCSDKSKAKGLCTGYHFHNGGSTSGSSSSGSKSAPKVTRKDKDCSDFSSYDEVVAYWNSKGYSATYDPENLDGWGNTIDDGIPCEPPSGYDKTKINNSPEQIQFKKDQQDSKAGEKEGYSQGLKDGYKGEENKGTTSRGSDAFNSAFATGYDRGYAEGEKRLDSEKSKAYDEGYQLGKKQNNILIPSVFLAHSELKNAFENGFKTAVAEQIEGKKKQYREKGYKDGKVDIYDAPSEKEFIEVYDEGYEKAQKELKDYYIKQGYEAAFTMLEYKEPNLEDKKFKDWYKEGFKSNVEVEKIKEVALKHGRKGDSLIIPEDYKVGKIIYEFYYKQGLTEYKVEKQKNQRTTVSGLGLGALAWLGRRFYVAKKMIG